MIDLSTLPPLKGKKALVTGIANDQSIAWGCAKGLKAFGADLAITYLNDEAKPHVEPLAKEVEASIFTPLNVQVEGQLEEVFDTIKKQWGKLDICVHSIAFAPKADLLPAALSTDARRLARANHSSDCASRDSGPLDLYAL
jgi:enoyl-[acyl-carrier protein] reductase I